MTSILAENDNGNGTDFQSEIERQEVAYFAEGIKFTFNLTIILFLTAACLVVAQSKASHREVDLDAEDGLYFQKLPGNGSPIHCLATVTSYTNERMVISGHHNNVVGVWNLENGRRSELLGHSGQIQCCSILTHGEIIYAITGSVDKSCIVWDILLETRLYSFESHQAEVRTVHSFLAPCSSDTTEQNFSGDRATVFSCDLQSRFYEWDLLTGKTIRELVNDKSTGFITRIETFRPRTTSLDTLILTSLSDNNVGIWNYHTGCCVSTIQAHAWPCLCISLFRPENHGLPLSVTGGCDKKVVISDCESNKVIREIYGHNSFISAVAVVQPLNTDAPYIVSICMGGIMLISDIYSGKVMRKCIGPSSFQTTGLAISHRPGYYGETILAGGSDGFLYAWNLGSKNKVHDINRAHALEILSMEIYSDPLQPECNVIATSGHDPWINLWNDSGRRIACLKGHQRGINCLLFVVIDLNDRLPTLISVSLDGTLKFWNPYSFQLLKTLTTSCISAELTDLTTLEYQNNRYLAACSWNTTGISIWNYSTNEEKVIHLKSDPNTSNASFSVQCVNLYCRTELLINTIETAATTVPMELFNE